MEATIDFFIVYIENVQLTLASTLYTVRPIMHLKDLFYGT